MSERVASEMGRGPRTRAAGVTARPRPASTRPADPTILSPEVEQELARRWRAGDREAGRRLVEACLSFVTRIALDYRRWGQPLEDLVQEGCVGLLEAAERYDPERGVRLVTYAAFWIRAEIRELVTRGYRIVRIGSTKPERRALRVHRATREQDPLALAGVTGLAPERAARLLPLLMAGDLSLDGPSGDDRTLADRLAADAGSPEEAACRADERERLGAALKTAVAELSPREQHIVRQRLMADEPETLEQIGATFGVTRERVRQLEERAKERMRHRLAELAGDLVA